jgi:hypothetical protein
MVTKSQTRRGKRGNWTNDELVRLQRASTAKLKEDELKKKKRAASLKAMETETRLTYLKGTVASGRCLRKSLITRIGIVWGLRKKRNKTIVRKKEKLN